MTLIPLSPPPGLNSDDTTFLAEGRWADGSNVRFRLGKPEPIEGWTTSLTTVAPGASNLYTHAVGATTYLVIGAGGSLFGGSGSPVLILTAASDEQIGWALQSFGSLLMAVPRKAGPLYQWTGSGSATEITQSPNVINDMIVTPERQILALGCNEEVSGTFNGLCIRGCDLEDPTDWTSTSTNNAFEHILDGQGQIVGGRMVGSYVAVWTTHALYIGQFLGDPGQTYRFDKVADNCGLYQADAAIVADQTAYWFDAQKRFRAWTPGAPPSTLSCPIYKDFLDHLANSERVFAFHNTVFGEVSWFYADTRDAGATGTAPARYIAVSLTEQGAPWFKGQIERAHMLGRADAGAAYGVNAAGTVFLHIPTTSANRTWYIQSADQYLDNAGRRMMIKGIRPDFEDQAGDVSLTVYMRDRPQSASVAKGPYVLTTATTKKDFRASGMIAAVKFSGAAATYARLGKPCFEAVPLGER